MLQLHEFLKAQNVLVEDGNKTTTDLILHIPLGYWHEDKNALPSETAIKGDSSEEKKKSPLKKNVSPQIEKN